MAIPELLEGLEKTEIWVCRGVEDQLESLGYQELG